VDPVATAASNNPLLKTLVAAVSGKLNKDVNLVDTLNGADFTVFAPVDSAFAKLPAETVKTLGTPAGADTLSSILTYHVIPGKILPKDIDGTFKTVNGGELTVTGSGDDISVGDGGAKVICGGVKTANATVYLIDTVLSPPTK
ncbi:MAG: fasciclin domain-containing protein, partial [Aeromicrobium sp.]